MSDWLINLLTNMLIGAMAAGMLALLSSAPDWALWMTGVVTFEVWTAADHARGMRS